MAKLFPMTVTLRFHITDGENNGEASYSLGLVQGVTDEAIERAAEEVKKILPDGFRLMTRHESMMHYLRTERGYRGPNNLAMPAIKEGDEWHDPETANVYMPSDEDDYPDED